MDINIGDRISQLRKVKGFTVNKLANKAGISQSYLREIELGNYENPSIDILDALCGALDITLRDFFTTKDPIVAEKLYNEIANLSPYQQNQLCLFLSSLHSDQE